MTERGFGIGRVGVQTGREFPRRGAVRHVRPAGGRGDLGLIWRSAFATLRPDAFLAPLRRTAFACSGLASRSSREEGNEPDLERRLVPEEGIEPTLPVKGTGF